MIVRGEGPGWRSVVRNGAAAVALASLAACGARTGLVGERAATGRLDAGVTDVTPREAGVFDDVVSDACSSAGAGVDRLGCVFPNGSRVPFGTSVVSGCARCSCNESGSLSCLAQGCPSVVTEGGMHGCILPDGRQVDSASWTQVGITWCYCDVGTYVFCRLPPCEGGGAELSPPPVIGSTRNACNEVELVPFSPPHVRTSLRPHDSSWAPIEPGHYVLERIEQYGEAPAPSSTAAAIDVSDERWLIARYAVNNTSIERANYTVDRSTGGLRLQEVCPEDTTPVYVRGADGGLVRIAGRDPYEVVYAWPSPGQLVLRADNPRGTLSFFYTRTR